MKNKISFIAIIIFLLVSISGLFIIEFSPQKKLGETLNTIGLSLAQLIGLIMLVTNGTILTTKIFRTIQIGIGFLMIGAIFKIMHWPGASIILLVSMFTIAITYLVRFIYKKNKIRLDVLKLLWVLFAYIGGLFILMHLLPPEFGNLTHLILWLAIIDFIITGIKNKTLFKQI